MFNLEKTIVDFRKIWDEEQKLIDASRPAILKNIDALLEIAPNHNIIEGRPCSDDNAINAYSLAPCTRCVLLDIKRHDPKIFFVEVTVRSRGGISGM